MDRKRITKGDITAKKLAIRKGETVLKESDVPGLSVRAYSNGSKEWLLNYRLQNGSQRSMTLGDATIVSPSIARQRSREILDRVAAGEDPSRDKQRSKCPTVGEIADQWYQRNRSKKKTKQDRSLHMDRVYLEEYIKPQFGSIRIDDLSIDHVQKLHDEIGKTGFNRQKGPSPITANRLLEVISAILSYSEPKYRPLNSNFVGRIEQFPEEVRTRVLSKDELERLGDVLREWPHETHRAKLIWSGDLSGKTLPVAVSEEQRNKRRRVVECIRFIALTGCRKNEALKLTRDEVDFERKIMFLNEDRTGSRKVILSRTAANILRKQPHSMFRGVNVRKPWDVIRAKAKIVDFHFLDFRRQLYQNFIDCGYSETIAKIALGIEVQSITNRYLEGDISELREAYEKHTELLTCLLEPNSDEKTKKPIRKAGVSADPIDISRDS